MSEFLSGNGGWIAAIAVGMLSAVSTIIAAHAKAKSDRDAARAPEWVGLTSQQTAMLQFMQQQIREQGAQLRDLQADMEQMKDKYWKVIAWVRKVVFSNPNILTLYPMHESFKDDV